jgi:hypothetical protein
LDTALTFVQGLLTLVTLLELKSFLAEPPGRAYLLLPSNSSVLVKFSAPSGSRFHNSLDMASIAHRPQRLEFAYLCLGRLRLISNRSNRKQWWLTSYSSLLLRQLLIFAAHGCLKNHVECASETPIPKLYNLQG